MGNDIICKLCKYKRCVCYTTEDKLARAHNISMRHFIKHKKWHIELEKSIELLKNFIIENKEEDIYPIVWENKEYIESERDKQDLRTCEDPVHRIISF